MKGSGFVIFWFSNVIFEFFVNKETESAKNECSGRSDRLSKFCVYFGAFFGVGKGSCGSVLTGDGF